MQEPQYRSPGVRELLDAVAKAKLPCMSIMNMPPLPYLERVPGVAVDALRGCYTDASVWANCDPKFMTLCSPDPQAFRPPEEKVNVLQVRLPTNFKSARFPSDAHTAILRRLEKDIEAARYEGLELPVKLKVHESVFVPLAKWAMLIAGNYRCVTKDGIRSIKEAVHSDLEAAADRGRVPRGVREVRRRSARAAKPLVGGARVARRGAEHRTRRSPGTDDRGAKRHALGSAGRGRAAGGREARGQPARRGRCRGEGTAAGEAQRLGRFGVGP